MLAQVAPTELTDMILLPGLCFFFGMLIWGLGWNAERNEHPAKWKWVSMIFLGVGLLVGFRQLWPLINFIDPASRALYASSFFGKKILYGHYLGFLLPFIGIVVVLVWNHFAQKAMRSYR